MISPLPYLATSVAETIATQLEAAAQARGYASLAIPGGRSPGPVLTALAEIIDPWLRAHLHLFWVDERAVPRGHAQRNDAITLQAWEEGGALPEHVHPMPAEMPDLEIAAQHYAAHCFDICTDQTLDVCLLGIGEDGHIASLFPEHPGLQELDPVFAVYDSPKPPLRRLSMSLPVLQRARSRIVLACGAAKGAVLAAIERDGASPYYPVSLLPESDTTWYCDAAALAQRSPGA